MSDPVLELYDTRPYPAASHPSTDPAVTAVSAALAGLQVTRPSRARILDIGCASGHNLLPLAARWPDSRFTGIDYSPAGLLEARESARLAGISNVEFIHADLRDFNPGEGVTYDYIIAHGIYSWVTGEVRQRLLDFCRARLSPAGVAFVSYNTLPGWSLRKSIVDLSRALAAAPAAESLGRDPEAVLASLTMATGNHNSYSRHLTSIFHDMLGKSHHILGFDEFGPINEPCTFLEFTRHASRSGLHYLGESQLADNFPASLSVEAVEILKPLAADPLLLQQTIDVLTNRTFRTPLLCRDDSPRNLKITVETLADFSLRCPHAIASEPDKTVLTGRDGEMIATFTQALPISLFKTLDATRPESLPVLEIASRMGMPDLASLFGVVLDCARKGHVLLRAEPVRFDPHPPEFPTLGPLRGLAATKGQTLVDCYHHAYYPDGARQQLAAAMDGRHSMDELAAMAKSLLPNLDFPAWCSHLASRGMFAHPR